MKVTSFGTLFDTHSILLALDQAVNRGQWLVFDNCHLLQDWDPAVVRRVGQLISQYGGRRSNLLVVDELANQRAKRLCASLLLEKPTLIHPNFKLWFITREYALYSIPGEGLVLRHSFQVGLPGVH